MLLLLYGRAAAAGVGLHVDTTACFLVLLYNGFSHCRIDHLIFMFYSLYMLVHVHGTYMSFVYF